MNQTVAGKTEMNLPQDAERRGRGRPSKPDALTPAVRAKRYRDAKRAKQSADIKSDKSQKIGNSTPLEAAHAKIEELTRRNVELQLQLDAKHAELLNMETKLKTSQVKPRVEKKNPLAATVTSLRNQIIEKDKLVSLMSEEMNNLRDASHPTQVKTGNRPHRQA